MTKLIWMRRQLFHWFKEVLIFNLWAKYQIRERSNRCTQGQSYVGPRWCRYTHIIEQSYLPTAHFDHLWPNPPTPAPLLYCEGMFPASHPTAQSAMLLHPTSMCIKCRMRHVHFRYFWARPVPCVILCFYLSIRTYRNSCLIGSVTCAQERVQVSDSATFSGTRHKPHGIRNGCRNPTWVSE